MKLYYYVRNLCNLIGLEQWHFSLIWNTLLHEIFATRLFRDFDVHIFRDTQISRFEHTNLNFMGNQLFLKYFLELNDFIKETITSKSQNTTAGLNVKCRTKQFSQRPQAVHSCSWTFWVNWPFLRWVTLIITSIIFASCYVRDTLIFLIVNAFQELYICTWKYSKQYWWAYEQINVM